MPIYTPPQASRPSSAQPNDLPPPPPAPTTPYDFFLEQSKPRTSANPLSPEGKRYGTAIGGGPGINRLALAVGGAIAVAAVLAVVAAFLPKDKTTPQWLALAQRQQEVIRVCTMGSKAQYQSTRDFAITCQTGVTTSQRELLAYMKKANLGYNTKELGLLADAKTDARLKTATSSSTFDDVFQEIAAQQLTVYDRALKAQLTTTTGVNGREVLTKNQHSAELLLKMAADGNTTPATSSDSSTD